MHAYLRPEGIYSPVPVHLNLTSVKLNATYIQYIDIVYILALAGLLIGSSTLRVDRAVSRIHVYYRFTEY